MNSLTEFSKGQVKPKFKAIKARLSIFQQNLLGLCLFIISLALGVYFIKANLLIGLLTSLGITFLWNRLNRIISVKNITGTIIEFDESSINVIRNSDTISKIFYHDVKSIRLKICILHSPINKGFIWSAQHAYSLRIRLSTDKIYKVDLLNSIYKTESDEMYIKTGGPSLTSVLAYLSDQKQIKLFDWKGKPFEHF